MTYILRLRDMYVHCILYAISVVQFGYLEIGAKVTNVWQGSFVH